MSSVRKGKGKAVAHKNLRFVNEEARERYEFIKLQQCIFERGFEMEVKGWNVDIVRQINKLGWECFCHPRKEVVLPWVHEFYSNLKFQKNDIVFVRGKEVHISAEAINEIFEVETPIKDEFAHSNFSPMEVGALLYHTPDPSWAEEEIKFFESNQFTREAKVWLLFVNASVMPTRHSNKISLERALIVFGILRGFHINVGRIISQQLCKKASQDKVRPLWFPTLITHLCRNAGVSAGEGDFITMVGHHITQTVIMTNIKEPSSYDKTREQEKRKNASSTSQYPSSSTEPKPSPHADTESPTFDPDKMTMMDNIEYIKDYLRYQHVYFNARLEYLSQNQAKLLQKAKLSTAAPAFTYQSRFNADGFLLHRNGERADPTIFEDSASSGEE